MVSAEPKAESEAGAAPRANGRISVMVVDDHAVIRQALRMLLQSDPRLQVVADAENGREAIAAVESLQPDVVLMDIVMPGLNGIDATRQIRRLAKNSRVVILSGFVDEGQLVDSVRAGASGYLLKTSDVTELVRAIQRVHAGETYYSEELSQGYDIPEIAFQARRRGARAGLNALTTREREILQLIAEGTTNQSIADELSISVKTVESHRANIMAKLHLRSRADLIRYAFQRGFVKVESAEEAARMLAQGHTDEEKQG